MKPLVAKPSAAWPLILALGFLLCLGGAMAEEEPAPTPLRVLAYNIRHGEGVDGNIDLARIVRVIQQAKPDLVALQEIDRHCTRSGNVDIATELGKQLKMNARFAAFMDFQGGEYGLAVLSRFPIEGTRRIQLPPGPHEPRCALEVVVKPWPKQKAVSLVSIHNDWVDESVRVAQVKALVNALKPVKHPVILAGDFNGEPSDASMKLLEDWTFIDKGDAKTFPSGKPRIEIDYIITRGFEKASMKGSVIDERIASDHRPVLGIIQQEPSD